MTKNDGIRIKRRNYERIDGEVTSKRRNDGRKIMEENWRKKIKNYGIRRRNVTVD